MDITTIGFDLAKTVFQVHGADGKVRPVLRRKLRRGKVLAFFAGLPSCLVGMEAWSYGRKLVTALSGGVFDLLDPVLERYSFDEFGELA